ncbi:V-type proton ATPase subunit S1-like [Rhinophrynus dorsalis]
MLLPSAVLLCLACVLFPGVTSVSHVPMLLWSSERSVWGFSPAESYGHITSRYELHKLLQPPMTPINVVLFLQDTLSMDDFTYYSSASGTENPFQNIQEILNSSPSSLVLPAVDWKTIDNLPGYLRTQEDWNIISFDNLNMSFVELDKAKSNLIIVRLQSIPRTNEMSAAKAFSGNDEQIGRLNKELIERGIQFIAIYTGMRPSKTFKKFDMTQKSGRQLLSTDTAVEYPKYPPLNVTNGTDSTCILLYATKILLTANKTLSFDLTNVTFEAKSANTSFSTCSSSNTTLSLLYPSPGNGIASLEIRFFMTNIFYPGSARNWFKLESIEIIQDQDITRIAKFNTTYASTPAEYSYHCQQVGTGSLYGEALIRNSKEAANWDIFISEFQIQGFNVKNNLFSYASDCTTFFTAAIWMALVSSFVLLCILAYGIFMIMQLTTNDRFDDPKGQALSVPQNE